MTSSTIRVLLIDDEESDYLMTRTLLGRIEGPSPEVEWAASYEEGLRILGERRHDVCLLDYFLDQGTGLELLRHARSQAIRTPVILLTGKGSREVDLEAMKSGAVDYLVKGAGDPEALERSLRYAVERHRAQEALRQSEERHRGMFDHLPLGLYRVTEEGEYIEANPHLIRTLEFPDRDTLRQTHARNYFVSPKDRYRFFETLTEQGVVLGFETEIRTANGRPVRIRNTARVHRGPAGSIEYVEGSVEDVSTLRSSEEVTGESAAFRILQDTTRAGILFANPEGRIRQMNPAAQSLFGVTNQDLEQRSLWDLFHPEYGPRVARMLEEATDEVSDRVDGRVRLVSQGGETLTCRATLAQVPGRDADTGSILILLEALQSDPVPPET